MPAATHRAIPRTRPRPRAQGTAIRWDRLGRYALLLLFLLVLSLYIGPARTFWSTWNEAKAKRADVAKLRAENERLRERRRLLALPSARELEARREGMARPGERVFILKGLPRGD